MKNLNEPNSRYSRLSSPINLPPLFFPPIHHLTPKQKQQTVPQKQTNISEKRREYLLFLIYFCIFATQFAI